jgi:DNA repair protein RecN (Recombination protein N)
MLALKTILADKDQIPTLIFDEIDSGISGGTAAKVAKRLSMIAKNHQVICITHLPQIASMADEHFLINKKIVGNETVTQVDLLASEKSINEIARLLGGDVLTETARKNAVELKQASEKYKEKDNGLMEDRF